MAQGHLSFTCFSLCREWDSIKGECSKLGTADPPDFKNPSNCSSFEPFLSGDRIKRACGAVGHGCEDCHIKWDDNPATQEEEDWKFIMEWEENNPYPDYY